MALGDKFDLGDLVRSWGRFRDSDGNYVDPTSVTVSVKSPAGTVTTPTVTKSAVGVYYVDVNANEEGRWWVRFVGTGTGQAAEEDYFDIEPSRFA